MQETDRCQTDSDCNEGRSCQQEICVGPSSPVVERPSCLGDHCEGNLRITVARPRGQQLEPPAAWALLDRVERWGFIGFADVTGDRRADLVAVEHGPQAHTPGTIWVAPGEPGRFGTPAPAGQAWCPEPQSCRLDDVDGDGRADLIPVRPVLGAGGSIRQMVLASRANPLRFEELAPVVQECLSGDVCQAADVDGDGRADLVVFLRGPDRTPGSGRVLVARGGPSGFDTAMQWHPLFCIEEEDCAVGDIDGDRKADIVVFARENRPGDRSFRVAFSTGSDFQEDPQAVSYVRLCASGETCTVADVDGDGKQDLLAFGRGPEGLVWRLPSLGRKFDLRPAIWGAGFCLQGQTCHLADLEGHGAAQLISVPVLAP